jgi:hypothetical protein
LRGCFVFWSSHLIGMTTVDWSRIARGVQKSREIMRPFINQRTAMLQLIAGNRYGQNIPYSNPIPYLNLLYSVYTRALVSSSPRCMITTKVPNLRKMAEAMQVAINDRIKQARVADTLRSAAADALVGMGIVKVGICQTPIEGTDGLVHDYGEIYCDSISLDDWVMDMGAKRLDQCGYMGHRLIRPRHSLEMDPRYDQAKVKNIPTLQRTMYDEQGNLKAEGLSRSYDPTTDCDHEDMVELWELWLPREQLIVLTAADASGVVSSDPLRVTSYPGPELGPYRLLRFGTLPDNILPCPPLMVLADMHLALNALYRKILKQAVNQKNLTAVMGGAEDDADRRRRAGDGDVIKQTMPGGVADVSTATFNAANLALFDNARNMSNYYAGNPESFAGLAPQSETLGQDKLLSASSSKQLQAMQDDMLIFTKEILETMAWYWWTMPQTYQAEVEIPGFPDSKIPITIPPAMREGHWLNLNFDIYPHSLQSESPGSKLANINTIMSQMMQWAPILQQQQLAPNFAEYLRMEAGYMNMPEIERLVMFSTPPEVQEQQEPPKMPGGPQGTRTYERVSRSAPTERSRANAEQMALLGAANQQQQEMNGGGM